jgi:hypothetical protein
MHRAATALSRSSTAEHAASVAIATSADAWGNVAFSASTAPARGSGTSPPHECRTTAARSPHECARERRNVVALSAGRLLICCADALGAGLLLRCWTVGGAGGQTADCLTRASQRTSYPTVARGAPSQEQLSWASRAGRRRSGAVSWRCTRLGETAARHSVEAHGRRGLDAAALVATSWRQHGEAHGRRGLVVSSIMEAHRCGEREARAADVGAARVLSRSRPGSRCPRPRGTLRGGTSRDATLAGYPEGSGRCGEGPRRCSTRA